MIELDERLVEALRDATPQPPHQLDPAAIRSRSLRRERRLRPFAPVLAAGVIVAVAVGVALTRGGAPGKPVGGGNTRQLVGAVWRVDTINGAALGRSLRLQIFTDGRFWQKVGTCDSLQGRLSVTETELTVRAVRMSYGLCPVIGKQAQEQHVLQLMRPVFTGHLSWSVNGSRLTLRKPGESTIVYVRPAPRPVTTPDHSLDARIVLDHTTAPANGQPISGQLILTNNTGAPIVISDACNGWHAVGLSNSHIQLFTVASGQVACASSKLRVGTTRIAIEVSTEYSECIEPGGSTTGEPRPPRCTGAAHTISPPLPPGRYTTTVRFLGLSRQPKPAPPVIVTLTRP